MFQVFDKVTGRVLSGPASLPDAIRAMQDARQAGYSADLRKLTAKEA